MVLILLQSCVCLTMCALFYWAVLDRGNDFVVNRFFLIFAPIVSILIPMLDIKVGLSAIYWDPYVEVSKFTNLVPNYQGILESTYLIGLGAAFVYQISKLVYVKEKLLPELTKSKAAFSFMGEIHFDADENLASEENRAMKYHERAHQYLGHHYDILLISALKSIFWFFPIIHIFEKWLNEVHEFQADRETLEVISRSRYKRLVVLKGLNLLQSNQVSQFGSSSTYRRVKMMTLQNYRPRRMKLILLVPMLVLAIGAFSINYSFEPLNSQVLTVQMRPIDYDENYFSIAEDKAIGFFNGQAIIIKDIESLEKREQAIKLMLKLNGTFD